MKELCNFGPEALKKHFYPPLLSLYKTKTLVLVLCGIYVGAGRTAGHPGEPVSSKQDGSSLSTDTRLLTEVILPLSRQQRQGAALSVSAGAEDKRCQNH